MLTTLTVSDPPNYPKLPHCTHFVSPIISSQLVEMQTSILVDYVDRMPTQWITNHP